MSRGCWGGDSPGVRLPHGPPLAAAAPRGPCTEPSGASTPTLRQLQARLESTGNEILRQGFMPKRRAQKPLLPLPAEIQPAQSPRGTLRDTRGMQSQVPLKVFPQIWQK